VREWLSLGLILVGDWSVDRFATPPVREWQTAWVAWDHALLDASPVAHSPVLEPGDGLDPDIVNVHTAAPFMLSRKAGR
jgi:hypothetical protein